MAIDIKPTETDASPSEAIVRECEEQLAALTTQQQEVSQRRDALVHDQTSLLQEQQTLATRRAQLEQQAQLEAKELAQAETDAKVAAKSPLGLQSATAKLTELRKSAKAMTATRKKELARIEERLSAIATRLGQLGPEISKEQEAIKALQAQQEMVTSSRNNAYILVGLEIYQHYATHLQQLQADVDEALAQQVNAQVALREEKGAMYQALSQHGGPLREQAMQEFAMLDDSMTRTLDAFVALFDLLEREAPGLVYRVGQYSTARALEIPVRDLDAIINGNPVERKKLLDLHREGVKTLKGAYQ